MQFFLVFFRNMILKAKDFVAEKEKAFFILAITLHIDKFNNWVFYLFIDHPRELRDKGTGNAQFSQTKSFGKCADL